MRRGQAAIEYLFMIAVALIMVMIVVRYVRQAAETAGDTINNSVKTLSEYVQKEWSGLGD